MNPLGQAGGGLHRAGRRPDWASLPRQRRNIWQRLAGQSAGVLTVGNLFTAIGFGLVAAGLVYVWHRAYGTALVLLISGRLCDVLDGWLADRTRTKSPLGELLDAAADKIETLLALVVVAAGGLLPWLACLLIVLPQVAIASVALRSWWVGRQLHPVRFGKLGMALLWLAIGATILVAASAPSDDVKAWLGYGLAAGALIAGWATFRAYVRQPT